MSRQHSRDPSYIKSKKEGYRARSAYKLVDLQKRYNIFKRAFYILDIGCHPGSWLQVCKKIAEENLEKYNDKHYHRNHFKILGVDVKRTTPIEGVTTIKEDITDLEVLPKINKFFEDKIDIIISDASINKTGIKQRDSLEQVKLNSTISKLASKLLKKKGVLVLKAFQGEGFEELIRNLSKTYNSVRNYKPESSKKRSNEIYVICLNKKYD